MAGVSNPGVEHDAKTRGIILHIVEQIKREGVFDRFRRDCLEELDSKEPYRQLKQRVESHVATFLSKQTFSANLPKNQLRTSLRTNINQSEVLSKGVDRLLEQVLVEKSSSFYKEIENLVEEHLISTGHYTRYERDKTSQKSDAQPRSEHTKLSDKEVEDIIKEETNKLLEASADERSSQESDRGSFANTPPPGTSGEAIEVQTLTNVVDDKKSAQSPQIPNTNPEASVTPTADLSAGKPSIETSASKESASNRQADESMVSEAQNVDEISETDGSKGQKTNALLSESENKPAGANNASEISPKPMIVTETGTTDASASRQSDLKDEPCTSNQNTSASQGKTDETIPKISDDLQPAAKTFHRTDATVVQRIDPQKGDAMNVDSPQIRIASEKDESRAETAQASIAPKPVGNPTTDIKAANISKIRANNPEVVKPKEQRVKPEVLKSGKPKVNKAPSKPAVHKTITIKPEAGKGELFRPDVSKAKVDKAQKPEGKVATKTKTEKQRSKRSIKPKRKELILMPKLFSTDEETDEDLGIQSAKISVNKPKKSKPEFSGIENADLSDSDITVSSVHTSDLSSLEDSMSDMEYEDYQQLVLKKSKGKESGITARNNDGESAGKEGHDSGREKSGESGACGNTKSGGEYGAGSSGKSGNPEELDSAACESGNSKNLVTEEENAGESGAGTGKTIDDESGVVISKEGDASDVKEEAKEKRSSTESIKKGYHEKQSGTSVSKDTDGESGNVIDMKIVASEKTKDESGATSMVVDGESSESGIIEKSDSKEKKPDHSDISSDEEQDKRKDENDSPQKTESRRSDSTESEAKSSSGSKRQAESDSALFKPIEPAESQVFPEPAAKPRGGPAFAQAIIGNTSDADNETTVDDSDTGNIKLGKRRHSRRVSTSQESESSNDTVTPTDEQKEPQAQRRSARVASKDRARSTDEKDDHGHGNAAAKGEEGDGDSARKLRRTRYSQEKTHEARSSKTKEEKRNEKVEKRTSRLASDSTESDVKPSKRSKRTVKPTRCYSPSENS